MVEKNQSGTADLISKTPSIKSLRAAAADCRACELWRNATQTVFGEGTARAKLMFIGEQPGDVEDREGRPFVGPAGRLFGAILEELDISRSEVYLTNVVKHFHFEREGKRRIHKKPKMSQIAACRPWLEGEIAAVKPQVIVCLGATAAHALLGKDFRVTQKRGWLIQSTLAPFLMATVHPSSILRAPDDATRKVERARFVSDLNGVLKLL